MKKSNRFFKLAGEYSAPTELSMPDTTWQQKIAALRGRVMKRLVEEVTSALLSIILKF
jgi:dGTPase